MAGLLWPLLGIAAGVLVAAQAPLNAELGRGLGSPVAAATVSFLSGTVILAVVMAVLAWHQDVPVDWRGPSPWLFVAGGLLGAGFVTATIVLVPRLGAAAMMALVVAGQLTAGMLLDRIGFLGLAVREITFGRVAGAAMLLAGALLIRFT